MRKKVLFLTAFVPSDVAAAEKNTKIMLQELSNCFDIDLVYFKYEHEPDYLPFNDNICIIAAYKNSLFRKLTNILLCPIVYPTFSVRFNYRILNSLKKRILKVKYDAIIFDHSQMFLYAKALHVNCPKIMLSHDVIAQRVKRNSNKVIELICKESENYCLNVKNSYVFSFSPKDCDIIRQLYGIDVRLCLDYIDPYSINANPKHIENSYVFIGKWSRADNLDGVIWFYNTIVPHINKPVVINIIGKNFPKEKISYDNPMVTTKILGFVENPYELIANSKAMLAPLFTGAGIKVKVIESLACGTPVIGTEIAFEGLPDKYSKMMLLANDVDSYLKAMEMNISIEERKRIKKEFIADYTSETIPQFLIKLLKS